MAQPPADGSSLHPKRSRVEIQPVLSISNEDKVGTLQPQDNALVVTVMIGGYNVKKVLVDQGSGIKIIYPDLFKGLKLRSEDLTYYDSTLIGFDGKVFFPKGQIRLIVQIKTEVVEVNFIVVDAYSPHIAIVARPWLHIIEAVSSTLHLKVKYSFRDGLRNW